MGQANQDAHLQTSDPAISAIGDCVDFPNAALGFRTRLESVQNAVDQARCVAARLVGRAAPYDALAWFWSDQGDLKLLIAGLSHGVDQFNAERPISSCALDGGCDLVVDFRVRAVT